MNFSLGCITPMAAAAMAALALAAAPTAAADNSEYCTNLNTASTKCERPGNVEVNNSLTRAYTSSQWATQGGQSGGPFGGTQGGGTR
jgi:hypothetical protein